MSGQGKDSWHPTHGAPTEPGSQQTAPAAASASQTQASQQQPGQQGQQQQGVSSNSSSLRPYQPATQAPVLPPPRDIGSFSYTQPPAHARSLSSHPENHVYSLSTFDGSALKSSQSSANREPPQQQAASTSGSPPTGAAGLHPQQSPPHMSQSSREGPPITVTGLVTGQGPPQQPQPQPSSSVGQSNGLPGLPGPQGLPGLPGAGAGLNGPAGQQQSGPAAALVAGAAGTMQPAGAQGGPPGNGPGGPILNDALSYLDQVKYQFQDQPDVYNKFLDIMKDFKSQAINTPGVIDRVSTLFSGHPSLIQGFNTFLPPGYRIECSTDPRDTKITVTTPSGVHHASSGDNISIGGGGSMMSQSVMPAASQPPSRFYEQPGAARWGGSVEGMYGPYASNQQQGQADAMEIARQQQLAHAQVAQQQHAHAQQQHAQAQAAAQAQAQAAAQVQHAQAQAAAQQAQQAQQHQMAQQGVNQLQNAAAQTNGNKGPGIQQPSGPGTPGVGGERGKGPVEFNHAISYVNKIKNRFSHQPEIYKNFLEILQTYQRESKPIQDVYSQVTQLFREAPDLLEDFKQFLPESAAQARAAAAAKLAAEEANGPGGPMGPASSAPTRLPALGTFPPPSAVAKEKGSKKRGGQTVQPPIDPKVDPVVAAGRGANKRHKITHPKPTLEQQITGLEPTLTPWRPEPITLPTQSMASTEELAFFDRVKKFIGNKQTYNEFLKLLNLFSQGLMDKATLYDKVRNFISGNRELLEWFKRFIQWDGTAEEILNVPAVPANKVRLSVCRALGPSYRLLPKLEAQKPCSGRDEMCNEVLNDQWASHPTWASEDSGFVAHKKNSFEDTLHRIEEERHDYDFNIEANLRTIQLLEPIAQRIASMNNDEKMNFRLQPGLGGQSKTIYQRVIKKVWGRDAGIEVIESLHNDPVRAVPLVLNRLKKKDEEWKAAQREWQKVWRDQTARVFWKSLDHQGITIKANDKRLFQIKSLVAEITAKRDEQINRRLSPTTPVPEYQFEYKMDDQGIILDISRLLAVALENGTGFSIVDREKIDGFIKSFIPLFFGISNREVEDMVNAVARKTPDEDGDESVYAGAESPSARAAGRRQGHDTDLLRNVLKRSKGKQTFRKDKDGSMTPHGQSRDSSQEPHDQDVEMTSPSSERGGKDEGTWISRPMKTLTGLKQGAVPMSPVEPEERAVTQRSIYTLYCNQTIYGFFRSFQILYDRLASIKNSEAQIRKDVEARMKHKVAHDLNIMSTRIEEIFPDTSATANFYSQILDMCEKLLEGEMDLPGFEESLRTVCVSEGWKLYTIEKACSSILKFIQQIIPSDSKDKGAEKEKTADILLRFEKDRMRTEFSRERGEYQELISYRRAIEGMMNSGDELFRIDWHTDTSTATIRVVPRDSPTVTTELTKDEKWNYYIQTYMMISPTEGIPLDQCQKVFLRRNLPAEKDLPLQKFSGDVTRENMEVRICVNTYRLFFMPGTEDTLVRDQRAWTPLPKGARERRRAAWREKVLPKLAVVDAEGQQTWDALMGKEGEDVEMKD